MDTPAPEWRDQDKIRQQFDYGPYPRTPLDKSPKEESEVLYIHNLVTPYYLRHRKVIDTKGKVILDAGCGSGYQALALAAANPGAKIVGIDLSKESVSLAQKRLQHHGFDDAEFHVLKVEDLPQLGIEFDYINCDEVLYLLPDPLAGLHSMKSVLKPDGIIRTNFHSAYQRAGFYRAQELFRLMGLMDHSPQEFEEQTVIETMQSLKEEIRLKAETWRPELIQGLSQNPEKMKEFLAMNFLFIGDTGFTIPEMFALLEAADLEFIQMVEWRKWEVEDLFKDPNKIPDFWSMGLAMASLPEKLRMYELMHPIHRLLDFWCTHPGESGIPVDDWDDADWRTAIVHLHPQLRSDRIKQELIQCVRAGKQFEISREIKLPTLAPVFLEAGIAACLLPLWEGAQPIQVLVDRYHQIRSIDPVTLEPATDADSFAAVKDLLNRLDAFLYVLIEPA